MKKSLLGIILTVILTLSMVFQVIAADPYGGFPPAFYGSLMINGSPAPAGTTVEARGENISTGIEDNPLITTQSGQYGGEGISKKLVIQPEDNETIETGTIINFYINGVEADQTFIWGETEYSPDIPFNLTVTIPVSRLETQTTLTSSNNPSTVNRSVTFTAAVSSKSASEHQPSGQVIFYDGTTLLGEYSLTGGQASYSTSALTRGTHTLKAVYQGDANFLGSENSLVQTVKSSGSSGGGGGSPGTTTTTTTTTTTLTTTTQTVPLTSTTTTNAAPIKVLDLSGFLDSNGNVTQSIEGKSLDGKAKISVYAGTRCTTAKGEIVTQLSIQQINNPGGNPPPTAAFGMAALCYDFQPSGALFSQPVSITLTYDPSLIPAGEKPYIALWNSATDKWETLETVSFDLVNNTVTVNVSHFTIYSVLFKKSQTTSTSAVVTTTTTAATSKTTPSPATTSSPKTPSGPSTGLIIGLIVVFIAVVIVVVYLVLKRKSKKDGSK